jgi:divalent metal cation (Fe/Co/Zn/Cd) transporter
MPPAAALPGAGQRSGQVRRALRLVTLSVAFGLASGAVSVASGIGGHSLAVLAVGLGVLADVTGSATLFWRFRANVSQPGLSGRREQQSAVIVAAALTVVAVLLIVQSVLAVAHGTRPEASPVTLTATVISLVVLAPLAAAKRRLGQRMRSRALPRDGTLSGIGAATSFLAPAALVVSGLLGWWQAGPATALIVAAVAAGGAWRTAPRLPAARRPMAAGGRPVARMHTPER